MIVDTPDSLFVAGKRSHTLLQLIQVPKLQGLVMRPSDKLILVLRIDRQRVDRVLVLYTSIE